MVTRVSHGPQIRKRFILDSTVQPRMNTNTGFSVFDWQETSLYGETTRMDKINRMKSEDASRASYPFDLVHPIHPCQPLVGLSCSSALSIVLLQGFIHGVRFRPDASASPITPSPLMAFPFTDQPMLPSGSKGCTRHTSAAGRLEDPDDPEKKPGIRVPWSLLSKIRSTQSRRYCRGSLRKPICKGMTHMGLLGADQKKTSSGSGPCQRTTFPQQ